MGSCRGNVVSILQRSAFTLSFDAKRVSDGYPWPELCGVETGPSRTGKNGDTKMVPDVCV